MNAPASSLPARPAARAARWLLPLAVVTLVALTWGAVVVQHTAGSYLRGESLWAKAQKRSVLSLTRYAASHDAADLADARAALQLPAADRRARETLMSDDPDYAAAERAFRAGGNDPRDVAAMARLLPQFARVPAVRDAVIAWEDTDAPLDSVAAIGAEMERAVGAGDARALDTLSHQLRAIDHMLTGRADRFSTDVAAAARIIPGAVLALALLLGLALVVLGRTVSRRLAAAQEAASRAERLRTAELQALVEGSPDMIARFDAALRHRSVNSAVQRLVGIPAEVLLGRTYAQLVDEIGFPADVARQLEAGVRRAFEARSEQSLLVTFPVADAASTPREFEVRMTPASSPSGEVEWVIATARDITALRASERSLRETEARLARAQKMEAVGQLAGGIAHEFNNVLTAVVGNLELAREDVPADGTVRADLDEALVAIRRATGLTRQLLTFGRQQILEVRRLDLNALVGGMESMTRRLVGDRIHVHADPDPQPAWVMADAGQLQQVLLNLVVNARDAMPDGGVLTVATGRERPPGVGEGAWVSLTVRDTGMGMDEATRMRALEPFFTTKPVGSGSGLGLSVVDGIVAQARGRLQVESAPGAGTTVRVFLPEAIEASATPAEPAPASRPELTGHGEPLLLVEDERAVRETTRRLLERAGYEVIEAKSAEDALMLWQRDDIAARVQLVVTDVMMPGLDGLQMLERLREGRPALRALVVSGYTGRAGEAPETHAAGGRTAALRKPFARDELLERVRTLLDAGE